MYVEQATISRADSAVTFVKEEGWFISCCEFRRFTVGGRYSYYSSGDGFVGEAALAGGVGWRAGVRWLCER